jgi:hypothetical protein
VSNRPRIESQQAPVRARQGGVEQGAAGVGVDLNQAWTVSAHVEVVAHEHARGPEGVPGDGRGVRQRVVLVGGQGDHPFDGRHRGGQRIAGSGVQKHGSVGEQVGMARGQLLGQTRQAGVGLKLFAQTVRAQGLAHAAQVQCVGQVHGVLPVRQVSS